MFFQLHLTPVSNHVEIMEQKKIMKQRASHEQKYEDPGHAALHVLMCTGT